MRAQCSVISATLHGVEAIPVIVEVVISNGIPGMSIVGMPDKAVQEAKERVRSAIQATGFTMPCDKIVVNLAPTGLKKTGPGFDLPIAVGILAATKQIPIEAIQDKMFIGELSLGGQVRQTVGTLAYGISAKKMGLAYVSSGNQFVPIDGLEQFALTTLGKLHLETPFDPVIQKAADAEDQYEQYSLDYKDIYGHEVAKRAFQIAAAGKHGLLMMGPPGSGKTMLASRMPSILPKFDQNEMLEAAVVHSVVGEDTTNILSGVRPFRNPHHSISAPGLLGGGNPIRPGEVSLAHCGVLFLDELSEFGPSTLQGLRQPMETGYVNITRAEGNTKFPADFTLIAASNPCPCGYFGDKDHECHCTDAQVRHYQNKIGGPLIDRIDIQLDVERLPTQNVLKSGTGLDSQKLREGVMAAHEYAQWRITKGKSNCSIEKTIKESSPKVIIRSCNLSSEATSFIELAAENYGLSGRGLINTLRVARTIADMEQTEIVSVEHLAEAIGFRLRKES